MNIFSAKLTKTKYFFSLHFIGFLSITHSLFAIGLASYHLYFNYKIKNQLYIECIDLIIVYVFNCIIGILNVDKNKSFFD